MDYKLPNAQNAIQKTVGRLEGMLQNDTWRIWHKGGTKKLHTSKRDFVEAWEPPKCGLHDHEPLARCEYTVLDDIYTDYAIDGLVPEYEEGTPTFLEAAHHLYDKYLLEDFCEANGVGYEEGKKAAWKWFVRHEGFHKTMLAFKPEKLFTKERLLGMLGD